MDAAPRCPRIVIKFEESVGHEAEKEHGGTDKLHQQKGTCAWTSQQKVIVMGMSLDAPKSIQ